MNPKKELRAQRHHLVALTMISDTHNRLGTIIDQLKPTENALNVLIFAGDATTQGSLFEFAIFAKEIEKVSTLFDHVLIVLGNHEFYGGVSVAKFKETLKSLQNVRILEEESYEINGLVFYGVSGYALGDEEDGRKYWVKIPEETDILVTHCPPFGILDKTKEGESAGSKGLREEVLTRVRPHFHVFGHIHEGNGTQHLQGTTFVNCASCDEKFKLKNGPFVFDSEGKEVPKIIPKL